MDADTLRTSSPSSLKSMVVELKILDRVSYDIRAPDKPDSEYAAQLGRFYGRYVPFTSHGRNPKFSGSGEVDIS